MSLRPIEARNLLHKQSSSQSQRILNLESRGIDRVAPIRAHQLNIEIYTSFYYRYFIVTFREQSTESSTESCWEVDRMAVRSHEGMPPESRASHSIANPGMIHPPIPQGVLGHPYPVRCQQSVQPAPAWLHLLGSPAVEGADSPIA